MDNKTTAQEPYMVFSPPATPTQATDMDGMAFDFNLGLRVSVPQGNYRVAFIDRDKHLTVYNAPISGAMATSTKRYFVNFRLEVWQEPTEEEKKAAKDKKIESKLIFSHDYNAKGKKVLLKFAGRALGDMLAWFPYAEVFRQKHGCELYAQVD